MRRQLRLYIGIVAITLLAGCGGSPAAPAPTTPATAIAAPAPAQPTTTLAPPQPTPTIVPAAATSAPPNASTNVPSASVVPPTATPAFPEARIGEASLPALQLLRTVGFGGARAAAIGPGNRLLAVATSAGVALFELPSLRHVRFDAIAGGAREVAFAEDGQTLAITTGELEPQQQQVRRVADGALISTAPAQSASAPLQVLSPDGQLMAEFNTPDSSPTPGVRLSRVAAAQLVYEDDLTNHVAFSSDSSLAALVAYDGTVRLLDANGAVVQTLELPAFWSVAFSPDGLSMVTAAQSVWVWDVVTSELRQRLAGLALAGDSWVTGAEQRALFSPNGALLTVEGSYSGFEASMRRGSAWAIGPSGASHAWDSDAGGAGIANFETYAGAISPATKAAAKTDDGIALIVDRGDGGQFTLQVAPGVSALAFSPDGALLAVADKAGQVRIVQVASGAIVRAVQAQAAPVLLRFSPDGALLGGRAADGAIQAWSVSDGKPAGQASAAPTTPQTRHAAEFIFTPDNALLISLDADAVRIHSVAGGKLVRQLDIVAEGAAIGPRQRLLGLVRDGRVELWGIR